LTILSINQILTVMLHVIRLFSPTQDLVSRKAIKIEALGGGFTQEAVRFGPPHYRIGLAARRRQPPVFP